MVVLSLGMGLLLFANDYAYSSYLPYGFLAILVIGELGFRIVKKRKKRYIENYTQRLFISLGIVLFAINVGYQELDENHYSTIDIVFNYVEEMEANDIEQYASVGHNVPPVDVEKKKGKRKKSKFSKRNNRKKYWRTQFKFNNDAEELDWIFIVIGVLLLLLALIAIVLSCLAFCFAGPAIGVLALMGTIGIFILTVFTFLRFKTAKKPTANSKKRKGIILLSIGALFLALFITAMLFVWGFLGVWILLFLALFFITIVGGFLAIGIMNLIDSQKMKNEN